MAINETIKLLIALAVGAAILYGIQYIGDLQQRAALGEQRGTTLETTSGILKDSDALQPQRVKVEIGVGDAKQAFQQALEEAKRDEPNTADRADAPVPDSVRRAYRERRLARERLGCIGRGCQARAAEKESTKR